VKGGGGTSFDPALALANEWMPDALVYFTDGFAPAPTVRPRVPVLWMLTPRGLPLDHESVRGLPGRHVRIAESTRSR
jgi:predicted metal-dependent peptidase